MKTKNFLLLVLCTLLSVHIKAADGDTFTANTIEGVAMTFKIISETDKTVQVDKGNTGGIAIDWETSGPLTIPSEVTHSNVQYSVVAIGDNSLCCEYLTSIEIPNSVTSIGNYAFSGCVSLISINIPNSITSIGARAFFGCEKLTSIKIPGSATSLGGNILGGCNKLTSITVESDNPVYDSRNQCNAIIETATNKLISGCKGTIIPNNVTTIGSSAFYACKGMTSIEIPSNVKNIGIAAFKESGITTIILHEGLETIASEAFMQSSLTAITIPNSVTSIGGYYAKTEYVTLANGKTQKFTYTYRGCFDQCENLQSVTFGTGLTCIPRGAFWLSGLESVHFNTPTNIKEIAFAAFYGCWKLKNIVIPEGVETIGRSAFVDNIALTSIKIPSSLTYFDVTSLSGAMNLKKIIVPSINQWCTMDYGNNRMVGSLNSAVENYDFNGDSTEGLLCHADLYLAGKEDSPIRNIVFPNGSTTIPQFAFYGASTIKSIEIPGTVAIIPELSFYKCTNLETVTLYKGLEIIGREAFEYCDNLANINLPEGLQTIQSGAFAYEKNLKNVIIPNSVTSVGWGIDGYAGAFQGCTSLESVKLGNGMQTIPTAMFSGCSNLQYIEIPSGVKTISPIAFGGCKRLKKIVFPNSVTLTEASANSSPAFYGCDNLTQVIVPDFNIADWCGKNLAGGPLRYSHHLYDTEGNDLIVDAVIPEGVTKVTECAFQGCESMTSLTLPSTITSIGSYSFGYCSYLTSVTCKMKTPCTINNTTFYQLPTCNLYIPYGTKDAYIAAGWTEDVFRGGIVEVDGRVEQSMKQTSLPAMTYGDENYALPKKASEGLTLTWLSSNTSVATISGNILTLKGAGTATITASQAGNNEYMPFSQEFTLTVAKAPLTITANDATKNIGEANPAFTATYEGFVNGDDATVLTALPTFTTQADKNSPVGTYDIVVSGAEAANYEMNYVNGTLTVVDEWSMNNTLSLTDVQVLCGRQIILPVNMSNTESIKGVQFDLTLPNGVTVATDAYDELAVSLTSRAHSSHSVSARQLSNGDYRIVVISMGAKTFSDTEGNIMNITLNVAENVEMGDYVIKVSSIALNTADNVTISPADVTATLTVTNTKPGDVNGDGSVNVTDVGMVIDHILENTPANFVKAAADVNGDGEVNVTDVGLVIDIILSDDEPAGARKLEEEVDVDTLDPQ